MGWQAKGSGRTTGERDETRLNPQKHIDETIETGSFTSNRRSQHESTLINDRTRDHHDMPIDSAFLTYPSREQMLYDALKMEPRERFSTFRNTYVMGDQSLISKLSFCFSMGRR